MAERPRAQARTPSGRHRVALGFHFHLRLAPLSQAPGPISNCLRDILLASLLASHLLALLLSSFLIRLRLLCPVDGVLLVQLQHLHLLLDGLHGWAERGAAGPRGAQVAGSVAGSVAFAE